MVVFAYSLDHALLDYECAVVMQDFEAANALLASIDGSHHDALAQFLHKQGFTEGALQLARDPELRFDLALELGRADVPLLGVTHA